ncbi:MAG: hypothetical protein COV70_04105 [Parcubacteria group bacterium CG11_big_fil_rev_8_21_14_0_20_39_22]|nr:MAG: hypothetical protein COV70_04105 [Parcubacteria group bacterium CG11_big_fil_rev_8_21_14_0_20_39_22]
MKILFTGGGSGGHFYPIIAIAEELRRIAKEERILDPQLYFMSTDKYNARALYDQDIIFKRAFAGKRRRYKSILNVLDLVKTGTGIVQAVWEVFKIYPDVVFGKGGYASFPALIAAKIFGIPVIIHESDSSPGRVNVWAARFARRIAISYPEAAKYFPEEKVALTGNPIRKGIMPIRQEGAFEFLRLDRDVPVILFLGGSQGSQKINEVLIDALPELVENFQVIHQTGKKNFQEVTSTASVILEKSPYKNRYKPFDYLNDLGMQMASSAASLAVSRAGSSIFEIALWGLPSIIIPIPEEISHDQLKNAFNYARTGSCIVIEENNLSHNILVSEIERLMKNLELRQRMSVQAKEFSKPDAAEKISREIMAIALSHEK